MSKRGREKKLEHIEKIRARREERRKADEDRKKPMGKSAFGLMPPWKRRLLESIKKQNKRKGL